MWRLCFPKLNIMITAMLMLKGSKAKYVLHQRGTFPLFLVGSKYWARTRVPTNIPKFSPPPPFLSHPIGFCAVWPHFPAHKALWQI